MEFSPYRYSNLFVINSQEELAEQTKNHPILGVMFGSTRTNLTLSEILNEPFPQYWIKQIDVYCDGHFDPTRMVLLTKDNKKEILNSLIRQNCDLIYQKKEQIKKLQEENDLIYKILGG